MVEAVGKQHCGTHHRQQRGCQPRPQRERQRLVGLRVCPQGGPSGALLRSRHGGCDGQAQRHAKQGDQRHSGKQREFNCQREGFITMLYIAKYLIKARARTLFD